MRRGSPRPRHSSCPQHDTSKDRWTPGPGTATHGSAGTNLQGTGRGARAGLAADRALHLEGERRAGMRLRRSAHRVPSACSSATCEDHARPSWSPALSCCTPGTQGLPEPQTTGFWVAAGGHLPELRWPKTSATPAPQKTPLLLAGKATPLPDHNSGCSSRCPCGGAGSCTGPKCLHQFLALETPSSQLLYRTENPQQGASHL